MTGFENLCMGCMSDTAGKSECPHCGWNDNELQMPNALPLQTQLQNRYIVGCARSSNGEGVTYLAFDTVLRAPVELREFFPQTLCGRADNGTDIRIIGGSEVIFSETLSSFLSYSRELAHLRELSSIMQIYDIFEENHTAYTISEWSESITLRYFVGRSGGSLTWNAARQLFMPVLSTLSSMHAVGLSHLGISPDTLCIMPDGKMKIVGFCISAVRKSDTDLPPSLVAGCAAIEQYVMDYVPDESTDVYGFSASLFFALTGNLPLDSLKRRTDSRLLIPTSIVRSIPPHVVSALANALQISPDKRTSTFERLRAELSAAPTVTVTLDDTQTLKAISAVSPIQRREEPQKREIPGFVWVLISCLVSIVIFTVVGVIWITHAKTSLPQGTDDPLVAENSSLTENTLARGYSTFSESEKIVTPDLSGRNFEVLSASSSANPDYQVLISTKQFSDSVPEGSVISQTPVPGTEMDKGTTIVVIVSQGAAVRTLPAIEKKSLTDASNAVTSAGFVPTKEETYNATIAQGNAVGYKSVQAGAQRPYGSQVIIIISKGPDPSATTPSVASVPLDTKSNTSGN